MGDLFDKGRTQTTTSQTQVPGYVEDAQKRLMTGAFNLTKPWVTGRPPRAAVAGMGASQTYALNNARRMAGAEVGGGPVLAPDTQASAAQLGEADIAMFQNPFEQQVVDTTLKDLSRIHGENLAAARAKMALAGGGLDNSRRFAVLEPAMEREFLDNAARTVAGLRSAGFDKAANLGMGNAQMRQAAELLNPQLQLQRAGLENEFRNADLQRGIAANAQLSSLGAAEQAHRQRELDAPFMMLDRLRATVPGMVPTTTTTTSPNPNYVSPGNLLLGGLGSLLLSDRGAKTDIEKVGADPATGVPLYAYRYKKDPKTYPKVVGPMADDMEKMKPGSTRKIGGKRVVNLGMPIRGVGKVA